MPNPLGSPLPHEARIDTRQLILGFRANPAGCTIHGNSTERGWYYMGPFLRLNTDFACGLAHKGLALCLEHPRKYSYRWLSQLADGKRAVSIDLTDVGKQPDYAQRCGREAAESLCAIDQTKKLHELAGRICPDAVLDSQESVRLARRRFAARYLSGLPARREFIAFRPYIRRLETQCS